MKSFITFILLMFCLLIYGQTGPGNNLGSYLVTMHKKFPELRYVKTDSKGDEYEDGYPEEGIASFFYLKNGYVVEECMICQANNDFPYQWYISICSSFRKKFGRALSIDKRYYKQYEFSTFNVNIIFASEHGNNTALIQYEKLKK